MFGMMIDIGDLKVKNMDLEFLCLSFRTSLFPNSLMNLVYVWYQGSILAVANLLNAG